MPAYKLLDSEQLATWRIVRLFGQYATMARNSERLDAEDRSTFKRLGEALKNRPWASRTEFYRNTSMDSFMLRLYETDILGLPSY